jgi:hypothetical protein
MAESDTVFSNNGDGDKILATVAKIIFDFTAKYPEALIFIKGSTITRTRWYQMGINRHWGEIEKIFYFQGYCNNHWEP